MTDRIDQLLTQAIDRLRERTTRLPESTYRLQFHAGFTFADATRIVSYLADLGVTHLYASPYLAARKGSTHGYDVVDPTRLNPELGTAEDYSALATAISRRGMGQLLDTVPNHMGVGTNENPWWNDVLRLGRRSRYAGFFDINWDAPVDPTHRGKVTLPMLGDPLEQTLAKGDLRLSLDLAQGDFFMDYFDRKLPVDPATHDAILRHRLPELEQKLGDGHAELKLYRAATLGEDETPLRDLLRRNAPIREHLEQTVRDFNTTGDSTNGQLLRDLLARQNYRLTNWRLAAKEINYRRFFDINDLAALSMEKLDVFEAVHEYTLKLIADGSVSGLRVDHPDGLFDPKAYFVRLQKYAVLACAKAVVASDPSFADLDWSVARTELLRRIEDPESYTGGPGSDRWPLYVTVEKILAPAEPLPPDWPVHGTSGYDALNQISGVFVDPAGEAPLTELSHRYADDPADYSTLVDEKKKRMLDLSFGGELSTQARELTRVVQAAWPNQTVTGAELRDALREMIAAFPVYRTYISADGVRVEDVKLLEQAAKAAKKRNASLSGSAVDALKHVLLQQLPDAASEGLRAAALKLAGRFQQLTAPVTAKGIEDTTFYVYNRLLSLNEVGGEPSRFGVAPHALHQYFVDRQAHWPYALSALSTHDTKRSEDVRARIHAISEMPEEWAKHIAAWSMLNASHRSQVGKRTVPTANEEYWIYQTLVGVWPFDPSDAGEGRRDAQSLLDRVQAYFTKAMREAKVYTGWTDANADHEQAVSQFIAALFDDKSNSGFLESFLPFQRKVARLGMVNSLSQTLLRLTTPGVPDTYQGSELWDLSLVDPDNRRPVDYERRSQLLADLRRRSERENLAAVCEELLKSPTDGRIKLWLTWRAISARKGLPGLFSVGRYTPVVAEGVQAANCFAFIRSLGSALSLVVVPRLPAGLTTAERPWPLGESAFGETRLKLPEHLKGQTLWNLLTGESIKVERDIVSVASLLAKFPVGLWVTDHV